MSQTFQRYEDEFQNLTRRITASFGADEGGYKDEEDSGEFSSSPSECLEQCDELLQQMALEARSSPNPSMKRDLLGKVRSYKKELQALKDEDNKRSLMVSARGNGGGNSSEHRERMRQQQEMLQNQNNTLDSARRVLQETEQVALEIGEELSSNRATIESAQGRIRSVTSLAGRAKRVVASMNARSRQQKMLLYGLAASVVIVFVVFFKFFR
mmetsp:Transcript_15010/g.34355  ORF Transcript_15010/g.34355 Transcript_15010/m.34355 type:complete len:212 (+) Transcript_15010:152-787(+)